MKIMTSDELLVAVNVSGLSAQKLTAVLQAAGVLVDREMARAEEDAIRAQAAQAAQDFERQAQEARARFDAASRSLWQ
jgi:hypothetical protein